MYPEKLEDLVPRYLSEIPPTRFGKTHKWNYERSNSRVPEHGFCLEVMYDNRPGRVGTGYSYTGVKNAKDVWKTQPPPPYVNAWRYNDSLIAPGETETDPT